MSFSETFLQELKMRNDIVDVISSYVNLKRSGRNMVGLCPFHGEKTPSFTVYTENGSFYCFGCGVGGDVITFIMKIENLDYLDAVKLLAQRAGMQMPADNVDDSMSKLRKRVYEANREAAKFYFSQLYSERGKTGLEYFYNRKLTDRTIRHFGLGFADDKWDTLSNYLKSKGFSENEIVTANLAFKRKNGNGIYDRFVNRVMFPIIDLRGNVIAFGGRIMTDQKPKYLNTSDTIVFSKSDNLFSLNNAKNTGLRTLILCEGYMDVIALNQAGFQNAVATLGTALTNEQAVLIKRYADEVVVCYDSDGAGQKATARAIPILRNTGLLIRVLTVPNGKDPDEFIKANPKDGHAAFKAILDASSNDVEYRLMKLKSNYSLDTTDGKLGFLKESAKIIATIENSIERDVYESKICHELNVDKNAYNKQVLKLTKEGYKKHNSEQSRKIRTMLNGQNDKINTEHYKKPRSSSAEEAIVVFLVKNPDYFSIINGRVNPNQFSNSLTKKYFEYALSKISAGYDVLTSVSADFSSDEVSKLYQLLAKYSQINSSREALEEYINVINEESSKPNKDEVANMSADELNEYIKKLSKSKK